MIVRPTSTLIMRDFFCFYEHLLSSIIILDPRCIFVLFASCNLWCSDSRFEMENDPSRAFLRPMNNSAHENIVVLYDGNLSIVLIMSIGRSSQESCNHRYTKRFTRYCRAQKLLTIAASFVHRRVSFECSQWLPTYLPTYL